MRDWLYELRAKILITTFMVVGGRIFDYVVKDVDLIIGRVRCIHFAINEREFNIAVREHVEALDNGQRSEPMED